MPSWYTIARQVHYDTAFLCLIAWKSYAPTSHPLRSIVVSNDFILDINSWHYVWMSHFYSQQDAHQQVHHLKKITVSWVSYCNSSDHLHNTSKLFTSVRSRLFALPIVKMQEGNTGQLKIKLQANLVKAMPKKMHWISFNEFKTK